MENSRERRDAGHRDRFILTELKGCEMRKVSIKNLTKRNITVILSHDGYCTKVGTCFCEQTKRIAKSVVITPGNIEVFFYPVLYLPEISGLVPGKQIAIKAAEERSGAKIVASVGANSDVESLPRSDNTDAKKLSKGKSNAGTRRSRSARGQ